MAKEEDLNVFDQPETKVEKTTKAKTEKKTTAKPKEVVEDQNSDLREKIIARLDIVGIEYDADAPTEELVALFNDSMEKIANAVKPTEVEDLLRQYNKEQGQRLIRVTLTNMNSTKNGLKGEFVSFRNRTVGNLKKFIPYNTEAMTAGWHIPFAMYEYLESKTFFPTNTKKDKFGMDVPVDREMKEYNIQVLPPLTQEEIDEIASHQRAHNTVPR